MSQAAQTQAESATSSTTAFSTPAPSSSANGQGDLSISTVYGDTESPKVVEPPSLPNPDHTHFAINQTSYIFNVGYMQQQWADVQVAFFDDILHLHRIILARSPYLVQFLGKPGSTMHLSFPPDVTKEAIHICLQHLYNPAQHLLNNFNARAVLSTAYILGGMTEMVEAAYELCQSSISAENVIEYIHWLGDDSSNESAGGVMFGGGIPGRAVPNGGVAAEEIGWERSGPSRYGEWTERLRRDVYDFLLHGITSPDEPAPTNTSLISIYQKLPFELFKQCTESSELPIPSIQDRFAFAKKVIAGRKKGVLASTGMEEIAVLAFKGGEGMELHITRKPKKRTAYTKVEG